MNKKTARKQLDEVHREFKQQKKSLEQEIRNLKRKYKSQRKDLQAKIAKERKNQQQESKAKILSPQTTPGKAETTSAQKSVDQLRQEMRLRFSGVRDE